MRKLRVSTGFWAALPVAAVLALGAGSGTALAGGHPSRDCQCKTSTPCPTASATPSASASPSESPSESPSASPSESPSPTPTDEGGLGGGGGTDTPEASPSESPSVSTSPDSGSGTSLPDTGPAAAMGGAVGLGSIGYASYMYLRSKKGVVDALRRR